MLPPYGAAWFKPFKFSLSVDMQGFAYSSVLWDLSTGRPTFVCTSDWRPLGALALIRPPFKQVKQ